MTDNRLSNGNFKTGTIILVINVLFLAVWMVAYNLNVYKVALVGAIYELIWLPLIICLFTLPIVSFIYWKKDGFKIKSKFLYLIVLSVLSITLLLTIAK
jgi:hypothetical protein